MLLNLFCLCRDGFAKQIEPLNEISFGCQWCFNILLQVLERRTISLKVFGSWKVAGGDTPYSSKLSKLIISDFFPQFSFLSCRSRFVRDISAILRALGPIEDWRTEKLQIQNPSATLYHKTLFSSECHGLCQRSSIMSRLHERWKRFCPWACCPTFVAGSRLCFRPRRNAVWNCTR